MMLHHLFCGFGRRTVFGCLSFVFDYLLIMNVIWNHEHFSTDRIRTWQ